MHKEMLNISGVKEMQIKIMLRFKVDLTLLEWLSSRTQTTTNVGEDVGKKDLIHC
jgi:hypothetical protein